MDESKHGELHTGAVYVNSVSGAKMYDVGTKTWTDNGATPIKIGENVQLYQHISVEYRTLNFHTYTATGEWFDGFEIRDTGNACSRVVELDEDNAPRP